MNSTLYGVISSTHGHIDTSMSLLGAKRYATLHGYTQVSKRSTMSNAVAVVATKVNGRWVEGMA